MLSWSKAQAFGLNRWLTWVVSSVCSPFLWQVEACGSLVTEERPQALQQALRSFFKRVLPSVSSARGYNTPSYATSPSTSPAPSPSSTSSSQSSPFRSHQPPLALLQESQKGYDVALPGGGFL